MNNTNNFIGCNDEQVGPDMESHVCICNTDACNERIDDITTHPVSTSTTITSTAGIEYQKVHIICSVLLNVFKQEVKC